MTKHFRLKAAAAMSALSLAACGGGGGSPPALPKTPNSQDLAFVLHVASTANAGSIRIALQSVNGVATTATLASVAKIAANATGCATGTQNTLTCTIPASAPNGIDVFAVTTYQSPDGSGTALASATVAATVTAGTAQSVALSAGGVPAAVAFSPPRLPLVADGAIHRFAVTLNATDATGATILGASDYQSPVSLQILNDPARALSLSTSSVSRPGEVVTVTYDSSKQLAQAQIVASDNAMTPGTLVAAPLTVNPAPLVVFDDAASSSVTLSESGFIGTFSAQIANTADAAVTMTPGTLNSGSSVATVTPKVRFDTTSLDVSDGNLTYPVPLAIVPHNSAYSAFGNAHTLLVSSLNMVESSDGTLWTGDQNDGTLVRFNPVTGAYSKFVVDPGLSGPQSVAIDSNGNVWFADGSQIGEYVPSTSTTTMYSTGLQPSARVGAIVAGKAGTMWFYDWNTNNAIHLGDPTYFGTIDTSTGTITEYPANNAQPSRSALEAGIFMSMAVASDNSLWFADGYNYSVGHLDPASGAVQEFKITTPAYPQESPMQLLIAPDGKVWAACFGLSTTLSEIASVDPNNGNAISHYTTGLNPPGPFMSMTRGSDGNLWFIEDPFIGFGFSSQLNVGVMNPATGAIYQYPPLVPEFSKIMSLVDRGDGTLWMLDNANGQIGKVSFK